LSKLESKRKIVIAISGLLTFSLVIAYGSAYLALAAIVPLLIVIGIILAETWPHGDILIPFERSVKSKQFRAGQISKMTFSSRNAVAGSIFSRGEIASILREGIRNKYAIHRQVQEFAALPDRAREPIARASFPQELESILSYGRGEQRKTQGAASWLRSFVFRKDMNYQRKLEKALDYIGENFK
jgi:hypothetical protein